MLSLLIGIAVLVVGAAGAAASPGALSVGAIAVGIVHVLRGLYELSTAADEDPAWS